MRSVLLAVVTLAFVGCNGLSRGCSTDGDVPADGIDGIVLTSAPSTTRGEDLADSVRQFDFDKPRLDEVVEHRKFRQVQSAGLDRCMRGEWRQDLREFVSSLEREEAARAEQIIGSVTEQLKSYFDRELMRLGPVRVDLTPVEREFELNVDTPCGAEWFRGTLNARSGYRFTELLLSGQRKRQHVESLLIGTWYELDEVSEGDFNIILAGRSSIRPDHTAQFQGNLVLTYPPENRTVFAMNVDIDSDWRVEDDILYQRVSAVQVANVQDPSGLFGGTLLESIEDLVGTTEISTIDLLTSQALVSRDETGRRSRAARVDY